MFNSEQVVFLKSENNLSPALSDIAINSLKSIIQANTNATRSKLSVRFYTTTKRLIGVDSGEDTNMTVRAKQKKAERRLYLWVPAAGKGVLDRL